MITVTGAPQLPTPTWFIAANLKSYVNIGLKFSTIYGELTDQVLFFARFQSKFPFSLYCAVKANNGGPNSSAGPIILKDTDVAVIVSCLA